MGVGEIAFKKRRPREMAEAQAEKIEGAKQVPKKGTRCLNKKLILNNKELK
jgi:hypothetical protein